MPAKGFGSWQTYLISILNLNMEIKTSEFEKKEQFESPKIRFISVAVRSVLMISNEDTHEEELF